jgi:hypothetical protein
MLPLLLIAAATSPLSKQQQPVPHLAQAAPATAQAPSRTYPYASLQLGIGFPNNYEGHIDDINTDTTLDLNTGFNGELALGYKFNNFRSDLSVGYGNFGVNEQSYRTPGYGSASVSGRGSTSLTTVMLNGYYDIPIRNGDQSLSRWSPYVGGGVGYANISTPACAASDCYSGGSAGAFAWQAKAGVSYRATERGFAFLEGGYVGTAGNTTVDEVTFGNFGAWRINLGWRQGFGGAPKPQAVVQAEPAPAPVIAPEPTPAPEVQPPIRGLW